MLLPSYKPGGKNAHCSRHSSGWLSWNKLDNISRSAGKNFIIKWTTLVSKCQSPCNNLGTETFPGRCWTLYQVSCCSQNIWNIPRATMSTKYSWVLLSIITWWYNFPFAYPPPATTGWWHPLHPETQTHNLGEAVGQSHFCGHIWWVLLQTELSGQAWRALA